MARAFNGSTQYIEVDSTPVVATPLTLAGWFNVANITAQHVILFVGDKDVSNHMFRLAASGTIGGDPVRAECADGTFRAAVTSTPFSANVWHHGCAVYTSPTAYAAFIDGGSKGTETVSCTPAGADRTSIGRAGDSSPGGFLNGLVAECAIWNVALTDAEVAILAAGYSPLLVRPQSLVLYAPLVREITDVVGAIGLANTGTTVGDHPRIYKPSAQHAFALPATPIVVPDFGWPSIAPEFLKPEVEVVGY